MRRWARQECEGGLVGSRALGVARACWPWRLAAHTPAPVAQGALVCVNSAHVAGRLRGWPGPRGVA